MEGDNALCRGFDEERSFFLAIENEHLIRDKELDDHSGNDD